MNILLTALKFVRHFLFTALVKTLNFIVMGIGSIFIIAWVALVVGVVIGFITICLSAL